MRIGNYFRAVALGLRFIAVPSAALAVAVVPISCSRDKVMELPDTVSNWNQMGEAFARNQLGIAEPSALLVQELGGCFSAANAGKTPGEAIVGESGKEHIYPPTPECVGKAVLAGMTPAETAAVAAPAPASVGSAPVLKPAVLGPLPPITIDIATLLRKDNKVTPISVTLPEGFTFDVNALGTIYIPMEQDVDIALVRVEENTAPVLTGQVLTGYGLKPGSKFKWNAQLPLSLSFQLLGSRTIAETADTCGATENGAPQILALNIVAFEVIEVVHHHNDNDNGNPPPVPRDIAERP